MNTYTSTFNISELSTVKNYFELENATFSAPQYMHFQARGEGFTASFYQSGKFVIQGKKTAELVTKYFSDAQLSLLGTQKPAIQQVQEVPYPHIGIDESGKGDFFGPLVIAAAYLDETNAKKLQMLGVCDSKKLNDKKILELETEIKNMAPYDIIAISPKKYNELYLSFKNLNKLLAWGHSSVLENLLSKTDAKIAISDQFASNENVIKNALKERAKNIELIQMPRAEQDTAVAAASILARAEFIKRISKLSADYQINLPKGASNLVLEQAKKFSNQYGKQELKNVAKLHFKTYENV